jgi:phosphoribosylformimino-5-aminoimidazole carboxamide ribotide isomerase
VPFDLYPSIDLRGGHCVRLRQGDFEAETVYDDDPLQVARDFAAAGTRWLHVVDLDAARTGEPANLTIIETICATVPCRVQVGGGIRSAEVAGEFLAAGAARVVIGTSAIERPELVDELTTMHPGQIAVGLDARGREVAVRGWTQGTGVDLVERARELGKSGASALVVTEIGRDGTMAGPDLDQLAAVLEATDLPVIASGGVGTLEDLAALRQLRAGGRSLAGAIVGRAIYESRMPSPRSPDARIASPGGSGTVGGTAPAGAVDTPKEEWHGRGERSGRRRIPAAVPATARRRGRSLRRARARRGGRRPGSLRPRLRQLASDRREEIRVPRTPRAPPDSIRDQRRGLTGLNRYC